MSSHHIHREEFFYIYDRDPFISVALADGSVNVLRTAGLSTEDLRKVLQISGFKEGELGVALNDRPLPAAFELAQHRRAGRMVAFRRHAPDAGCADQESIAGPATRPSH